MKLHILVAQKQKAKPKPNTTVRSMYIICVLYAFFLYCNTLGHEYAYDDFPTIYGNQITMQGFAGIPELVHTSYWYGLTGKEDWLYRPLSMVMFAAEWGLAPNNPFPGHLINVLLYAFTAFVLMRFLLNLFEGKNPLLPFAVAMLWIAHPIHTEVVANIKSRDEILCFLFCILALENILKHVKASKVSALIKACLFYFLALMSKESAITLIAVIPLMIYCFSNATIKDNLRISVIALVPASIYMVIRGLVLSDVLNIHNIPLNDNALIGAHGDFNLEKGTAFYMMGLYLKLLFVPYPLSCDYSYNEIPLVTLTNPVALFALVVYAASAVYALIRLTRKDPVAFGILYFIITISVVVNVLFLTRSTMAERFLYMPSLGFAIVVVVLIGRILKIDFNSKVKYASLNSLLRYHKKNSYLLVVILFIASIQTIGRNPDWKNDTTIFSTDVLTCPNSARLHFLYGNHMAQEVKQNHVASNKAENYYNIATEQFTKSIAINPYYFNPYFGLAEVYEKRKQPGKALELYRTLVERLPDFAEGYSSLGNMYFKMQQYDSAIIVLQKAITLKPDLADAYNNMGSAYFSKNDLDNAIVNYKKAIALNNRFAEAWKNLGSCYGTRNEYDNAIDAFQKSLLFAPGDADCKRFLDITIQRKNDAGLK